MRKSFSCVVVASLLLLLIAFPRATWAWGSPGHMAVAYVAWKKLESPQKARVLVLLQQNPYYNKWLGYVAKLDLTGDDHDAALFMFAATWPDEIKSDSSYKGTDAPPKGLTGTEKTGSYDDMMNHKYWHFVDTPYIPGQTNPGALPTPNAQLQIVYFASALNTAATDRLESYDLVWLEHLVGDIHQPLHATTRFLAGKGDIGGNNVKLDGSPAELHAYWDDIPGKQDQANPQNDYTAAMTFCGTLTPAPTTKAADLTVDDWRMESFNMAKSDVYVTPIAQGLGPYSIDPSSTYAQSGLADARTRIEIAGERLAAIINANLK